MFFKSIFGVLLTLSLFNSTFAQTNLTQFRGAGALGVATDDPNLPDKWSATENVVWRTDIPGTGWSSPVVWGNAIFLTSVISASDEEKPKKGLYFGGNREAAPRHPRVA